MQILKKCLQTCRCRCCCWTDHTAGVLEESAIVSCIPMNWALGIGLTAVDGVKRVIKIISLVLRSRVHAE